jgi:hypothetical protein
MKTPKEPRAGTLRARCLILLSGQRATMSDVVDLVKTYDLEHNKHPHNLTRRAYELVRIMQRFGYGVAVAEGGVIQLIPPIREGAMKNGRKKVRKVGNRSVRKAPDTER